MVAFNTLAAVNSYAEVQDVYAIAEEKAEIHDFTVTISLDLIECAPEKLTEYGIKYPQIQSDIIHPDKDIRDKLSRLKKDKDIKILYSTKVTTCPDNKVIVDNRQPLEYLTLEEKDATTLKKEIAYTGGLFEVKPTIAKDGKINLDYHFWVGELKGRVSNNKDIPQELGYPVMDTRSSQSAISLENGETIIMGGMVKEDEIWTNHEGVMTKKVGRKALVICIGADINQFLQLAVKSDKKIYMIGEPINITLSLTNISQDPIYVVTGFLEEPYSIKFAIRAEKGKWFYVSPVTEWIHALPKEAITKLMPGTSIEHAYTLLQTEYPKNSGNRRAYMPSQEGKYIIQVEYTNIENAPEIYGFKLWKGQTISNDLIIEIKND